MKLWRNLVNPFEVNSERKLLAVGLILTALCIVLASIFKVRFDGFFDLHLASESSWFTAFSDMLINTIIAVVLLLASGKGMNTKTRLIDIINTVLVSNVANLIVLCTFLGNSQERITTTILENLKQTGNPLAQGISFGDLFFLMIFALVVIVVFIYRILLLYNGFKVATNMKSIKHTVLFGVILLVVEVITKCLTYLY